jgi:hypothetical protein
MGYRIEAPFRTCGFGRSGLIIAAVLAAAFIILAVSPDGGSDAASSGTCGDDLRWNLDGGQLTIYGSGPMSDYTNISQPWGWGAYIRSVSIEDGATSIGSGAFRYCHSLAYVSIPSSVTSIGKDAFAGCTSLASVSMPSEESIGNQAFYG